MRHETVIHVSAGRRFAAALGHGQLDSKMDGDCCRSGADCCRQGLRTLYVMNALLLAWLALDIQGVLSVELSADTLFVYVLISLFVPFYIIPAIVKRF